MAFNANKVHGTSFQRESFSGDIDFYTIRTLIDITPDVNNDPTTTPQKAFDKLIEVVNLRVQPVILGNVPAPVLETSPPDLLGGTGSVNVYTVKFAVEHVNAWTALDLGLALDGLEGFVHTSSHTADTVAIVIDTLLKV